MSRMWTAFFHWRAAMAASMALRAQLKGNQNAVKTNLLILEVKIGVYLHLLVSFLAEVWASSMKKLLLLMIPDHLRFLVCHISSTCS